MSSSNRVQLTSVKEVTVGTTPNTPRMRKRRDTGEGLKFVPVYVDSEERRDDGMNAPPINVGETSGGDIKNEFFYPAQDSPDDVDIQSALCNTWNNTNSRDNDGTADSVITGITTLNTVATVTNGPAFVANHLVRFTGMGVANNNGNFKCTSGSATVPRFLGSGITDEAAPPAAARMKVIGFEGDAGDITAAANGLASTVLDFTTIPEIVAGKWIKVDSTTAGYGFATAGCNGFARITSVAAHLITLDNLPSGWGVDAGVGKTIRVYIGDQIKDGTTQVGQSFERGFMGQAVPTYIVQPGMVVTQYQQTWEKGQAIKRAVTFMGMTGASQGTAASLDASPDAPPPLVTYPVMATGVNVGRIAEAGAALNAPNFVKGLTLNIANNITPVDDITVPGAAGLNNHTRVVSGTLNAMFGDNSLYTKFFNGMLTSLNWRAQKNNRAFIVTVPQLTYNADGSPNAAGSNQDVMLPLGWKASKEETITNAQLTLDRLEYYA